MDDDAYPHRMESEINEKRKKLIRSQKNSVMCFGRNFKWVAEVTGYTEADVEVMYFEALYKDKPYVIIDVK